MARSVSIVEARRMLGQLAERVRRGGDPVVLTRRGLPVARIVPEPARRSPRDSGDGPLGELRGSVRVTGSFADLLQELRRLRREFAGTLGRRTRRSGAPRDRARG